MTTLVAYQAHAAVSWVRILCCLLSEPCTGRVTQSQVPAAGCGYGSPRWVKVASRGSSHLLSNSSRSLVVRTVCNPIGLSSQTLPPSGRCPTFTVDVYLTIGLPAGECSGPCRSSLVKLFNLQQLAAAFLFRRSEDLACSSCCGSPGHRVFNMVLLGAFSWLIRNHPAG